ncbi:peptide-methionine (S)-S-oxide reductase MsrA [Pedobacter cryophilus]|uniref:Peptide methionine sulfoxide reductase MsrA n=1 Tax=Pedobacter cryophilus TaxID=2571271 RepID=A0A4U1C681_9SPHI|nr:peptide-methionine (S)-S-oxide reductase MsrA [Pedobacter cryophilus]TKC00825.1 peptide-methionine (S)-S-oxide reductase MsrA [Pedobacter cryophilus]
MNKIIKLFSISVLVFLFACNSNGQTNSSKQKDKKMDLTPPKGKAVVAFAEGCFWCSEHIFEAVAGVGEVVSGYAGGTTKNPTYDLVNTETTGHAETVLVYYDPKVISYEELVKVFFASHDPTTKDQQGPDRGSSYRSILFYQTDAEKEIAMNAVREISKTNRFAKPLVTELQKLEAFYEAEEYHQDYINAGKGSGNPYVNNVSLPRFEQFKKTYKGKLKKGV